MAENVRQSVFWRAMADADIHAANVFANQIHADYPEEETYHEEKLRLFSQGCFILDADGEIGGYCFSHPWDENPPPKLNAPIGSLPARCTTYFIHDLTLAQAHRGKNHASALVERLAALAQSLNLASMTLVSIYGTGFWRRHGFRETPDVRLQDAAHTGGYGSNAVHMTKTLIPPPLSPILPGGASALRE